jgi:uncharacterized membrane protein
MNRAFVAQEIALILYLLLFGIVLYFLIYNERHAGSTILTLFWVESCV